MKHCLLLLAVAATFCLGACADGIEPDGPERKAAGYGPDPMGHIPRKSDSGPPGMGLGY